MAALLALVAPVVAFVLMIWIDDMPLQAATPPHNMKNLDDFRKWKGSEIHKKPRSYTDLMTGRSYVAYLAPSGRVLASGPSVYLFDKDGNFIDWTPDMGDIYTYKYDYDLSSGNLK